MSYSIIFDTNILLLLLVGQLDLQKVGAIKRVKEYTDLQYKYVANIANRADSIKVTPNILTEVSNLVGEGEDELLSGLQSHFQAFVLSWTEKYTPSKTLVQEADFQKLGLSDLSIIACAYDEGAHILTADHALYGIAQKKGLQVQNLWHYADLLK